MRAKAVQHNKKYFGLQYHSGISGGNKSTTRSECWIGDSFGNYGTKTNCYQVNDGKFVGDSLSNAVYQVPNYAQTYEDNKVPEGCWMEPNGNVRYNKGKSDKPCGYVSNGLPKNCIQRDGGGNAEKECVGNWPARHQRVDADRHETPPVRQGPRRRSARWGNAGRLPRVQTGNTLRLSLKSPDTAAATVQAGRRIRLSKATIRISKTTSTPWATTRPRPTACPGARTVARIPRPFSPGILRGYSARHRRPVPKAREKVRGYCKFDHEHDHRRLRESVLVDGRVRGRRQVRKVRPALPLDHQADDLSVRVQRLRRQRGQYGQVHWGALTMATNMQSACPSE